MNDLIDTVLKKSRHAARKLQMVPANKRKRIITSIARALKKERNSILAANKKDLHVFVGSDSLRDRLALSSDRIDGMSNGAIAVTRLHNPVGDVIEKRTLRNGLLLARKKVPFGVIAVIYESRPNVTVEIATLCLLTGNAVVLRGGKEAINSNRKLIHIMQKVIVSFGLPAECVSFISSTSRNVVSQLLTATGKLDLIIPRGGSGLITYVRDHATVPVIETGAGVCHTYVEKTADIKKAIPIIVNAKTQRPTVCNALDTLVLDASILGRIIPLLCKAILPFGVRIYADQRSHPYVIKCYPKKLIHRAKEKHFGHEFLSLGMSIKTVNDSKEGIAFVSEYTSGHSEAILTRDQKVQKEFLDKIDAACVYVNASTRFSDGFEFGLGAEVGISTQKLHTRGPMGLDALTTYKWLIVGNGQIRK